jgi:hypothetical protein
MISINIDNVEDLIFFENNLHHKLPDFEFLFRQWKLGKMYGLRSLIRQSLFDFLNQTKDKHIEILKKYFGQDVIIENNLDYHIVKNTTLSIEDPEAICEISGYNGFSTYRKDNQLYISFWR